MNKRCNDCGRFHAERCKNPKHCNNDDPRTGYPTTRRHGFRLSEQQPRVRT